MARQDQTPGYYEGLAWPSTVKSVNALHDAAVAKDIWTPASGKKFRVLGWQLQCFVGVALQNAAAGDHVLMYDEAVTAPIAVLGVVLDGTPVAGSILSSGAQTGVGAFAPAAATAAEAGTLLAPPVHIPGGYLSSAADNDVKVALVVAATGAVVDVGTGELNIFGTIWGHEE